jgi:hypothetical protein
MPLRANLPKALPMFLVALVLFGAPTTPGLAGTTPPGTTAATPTVTPTPLAFLPLILKGAPTPTATSIVSAGPAWLVELNLLRALAKLPPATENAAYSDGCFKHGRYMVWNGVVDRTEDPSKVGYTAEGAAAAPNSNLAADRSLDFGDVEAVDSWTAAPFHGVAMIDPRLAQSGFGNYHEAGGYYQSGACLDVLRGLADSSPPSSYPVLWPGAAATVSLRSLANDFPDPLSSCPGFTRPAGLPIYLLLGGGSVTPQVTASALLEGATPVPFCTFDETNYTNADASYQALGRLTLDSRDAIVIIPRNPLTAGAIYTVTVAANGQTYTWSFTVSPAAARPDRAGQTVVR